MSPGLRLAWWLAAGIQLAVIGLFTWIWVVTGDDAVGLWIGIHSFFGALATHALWSDRQKRKGLQA